MWIFTVNGFFTFVVDRKDPSYVWLRARMREDLERNFPGVTVEEHPGADYLYRAKITRAELSDHMVRLIAEADVTSHFKDEMIRRAAKPKTGNRSSMMYAIWNAGAAMQPYAPYSRVPRSAQTTYWKPTGQADRRPGAGQGSLYGGTGSGRYGSEFDWDTRDWGGTSSPDPVMGKGTPLPEISDDEMDEIWASLSDEERDAILDQEQDRAHQLDAQFSAPEVVDVLPDPRNRPGTRRQRRKGKRKNRHNQERTAADQARYEQERRDGKHGSEARNRQSFLDKKITIKGEQR